MGLFRSAPQAVPEYSGDSCRKLWKGIDPQRHPVLVADEECWNEVGSTSRLLSFSEASLITLLSSSTGELSGGRKLAFSPILYLITAYHVL